MSASIYEQVQRRAAVDRSRQKRYFIINLIKRRKNYTPWTMVVLISIFSYSHHNIERDKRYLKMIGRMPWISQDSLKLYYKILALVQTDTQTHTSNVNTEDTFSGFQEFFLQPIIKDWSKHRHWKKQSNVCVQPNGGNVHGRFTPGSKQALDQ